MDKGTGVGGPLLVVAEHHLLLVQGTASEEVGFRHARGLHGVERGASVEVNGRCTVGSDGGDGGGERGEDGAGGLLEGGARQVGTEQIGVSTAIQEEVRVAHVR